MIRDGGARGVVPLAVNKSRAAELLSMSVEFFDVHVAPEVKAVRRGRRWLYPVRELERWLERNATGMEAA